MLERVSSKPTILKKKISLKFFPASWPAIRAVDAADLVKRSLQRYGNSLQVAGHRYDLSVYQNVYVAGAGKAAARMGSAAEEILAESLAGGTVVVKYGHGTSLKKIAVL